MIYIYPVVTNWALSSSIGKLGDVLIVNLFLTNIKFVRMKKIEFLCATGMQHCHLIYCNHSLLWSNKAYKIVCGILTKLKLKTEVECYRYKEA